MRVKNFNLIFFIAAVLLMGFIIAAGCLDIFKIQNTTTIGFVFACVGLAAIYVCGAQYKKRVDTSEYKVRIINRYDLLALGTALFIVMIFLIKRAVDFIKLINSGDLVAMEVHSLLRPVAFIISFIGSLWFYIAAYTGKKKDNTASALITFVLFLFLMMVSENAFLMPLPDIALYLPRLFSTYCAAMFFVNVCIYMYKKSDKVLRRVLTNSLCGAIFGLCDMFFWIIHRKNDFFVQPLHSIAISGTLTIYFLYYSFTFSSRLERFDIDEAAPDEPDSIKKDGV